MTVDSVLQVAQLRKRFGGITAVDDVEFELGAGQLLAIIGPNGAGKSTCFNMIGGQIRADTGQVRFLGQEILGLPPRAIWRRGVGRTFQVAATFGSMTVIENVQVTLLSYHGEALRIGRRAGRRYRDEAAALLERVGMADQAERSCGVLAYGDVKRVELAMALANAPRLLLMDEPTAGMAPRERVGLMALTVDLVRDLGVSVLFTEHDMDVVFGHADRVVVLDRGTKLAEGTPEEVRADARVREIYLGGGSQTGQEAQS